MKSHIRFSAYIGALVIALALVAIPVFGDSQNTPGGSYVKMAGGKSLSYWSYTPVSSTFSIGSTIKPIYQGTLISGRPSVDAIINARSNSLMPSELSSISLPDSTLSLPSPAYSWDEMFTLPPSFCGCGAG